jgi:hypothetical protein
MRTFRPHAIPRAALVLTLALGLAGCGGGLFGQDGSGGRAGGAEAPQLAILTSSVPATRVGEPYPATRLAAGGARGPVRWTVARGALPPGIHLTSDGLLTGRAEVEGIYEFDVLAWDGAIADSRPFKLSVGVFTLVAEGLRFEKDAWGGEALTLRCLGHTGQVVIDIVSNDSGATLGPLVDGAATYTPGPVERMAMDRVVAVDLETGGRAEFVVRVFPHPAPHLGAEFGRSDVWWVSFEGVFGSHDYSRDWDAVLARVGLRSPEGTDLQGGEQDQLASYYVRRKTLARLNRHFGRNADGTQGTGLPVSFTMERPDALYAAAAPGGWLTGQANRYSVISVGFGSQPYVVGTAFLDGPRNDVHENNTTGGGSGSLGVFPNQMTYVFNNVYQNRALPDAPIGAHDVPALRALVYDLPMSGPRYEEIRRIADGFAESVALVLAHEIGHSLGLAHTATTTPGSIMNASVAMSPGAEYAFVPADEAQLRANLPGPNRYAALSTAVGASVTADFPEGGLSVCRTCNLRLAPAAAGGE